MSLFQSPLLTLIVLPALGALLVLVAGRIFSASHSNVSRVLAAGFATGELLLAVSLLRGGAPVEAWPWMPQFGISFRLTLDSLSVIFVVLTAFVTLFVALWGKGPTASRGGWFAALLTGEAAVMGAFLATDLLVFYVFYEVMLLPILVATMVWGGPNRQRACFKFLMYTLGASALMFAGIVYIGWRGLPLHGDQMPFSFDVASLAARGLFSLQEQRWLGLAFIFAFLVKIPAVPFHSWLPDSYREAPSGIRAFMAAILGKVGVYGVFRFVIPLFPNCFEMVQPWLVVLGAIGIVYGALVAMSQRDLLSLLAYSSVSHLGFCVMGLGAGSSTAMSGVLFQCVSHGFVTVALFLIAASFIEREGTGEFIGLGGVAARRPMTASFLMVFCFASVALPLTSGFVGELLIFLGTWGAYPWHTGVAMLGMVFGAAYTLTAYLKSMFGPLRHQAPAGLVSDAAVDLSSDEVVAFAGLTVIIIALGIFPGPLLSLIDAALALPTGVVVSF